MKRILVFTLFMLFAVVITPAQDTSSKTKTTCYKSSMHCAGCENAIFETLRFEKGVKEIKTDLSSNTIKVVYDSRKNNSEALAKVIQGKGYKADVITEEEYKKLTKPEGEENKAK